MVHLWPSCSNVVFLAELRKCLRWGVACCTDQRDFRTRAGSAQPAGEARCLGSRGNFALSHSCQTDLTRGITYIYLGTTVHERRCWPSQQRRDVVPLRSLSLVGSDRLRWWLGAALQSHHRGNRYTPGTHNHATAAIRCLPSRQWVRRLGGARPAPRPHSVDNTTTTTRS